MTPGTIITCGIYLFNFSTGKFLICHPTNASWKNWSIPKGLKDKGENEYEAACRELREETGINVDDLHILSLVTLEPVRYKKQNKSLCSFLIVTDTDLSNHVFRCDSTVKEGHPEIDKWAWVKPDELLLKVHESQRENYTLISKHLKKKDPGKG